MANVLEDSSRLFEKRMDLIFEIDYYAFFMLGIIYKEISSAIFASKSHLL